MIHLNSFPKTVIEHHMDINSTKYTIIDGTYISRRCCGRKWGIWFKDVTAILYAVDMSEYDQHVIEDVGVCTPLPFNSPVLTS